MARLRNLNIPHKLNEFHQDAWMRMKGIMGNKTGVCYGLSAFWIIKGGGPAFQHFANSPEAKENVQSFQNAQADGSLLQAKLVTEGQKVVRDGHLYWYPLAEMYKKISDPGHYLIGLKKGGKGDGHAIACSNILKGGRVFDPNIGQVSFTEKSYVEKVARSICDLYPYDTAMWVKSIG